METAHEYPAGCCFKTLEEIRGRRITIMGLGLNGGGEACARFFLRHGAEVLVTDMKGESELKPTIDSLLGDAELDCSRLKFVLGEHRLSDFAEADCVIKNPGIRFEGNKFLAAAKNVETDLSVFLSFCKSPIVAITGSKGKSSTASAAHYGLVQAGFKAFLGGNITVSPLTFLEETDENTPVVIEFSSWQLRDLRGRGVLRPKVALVTKIVADHQNWYHAMEPYVADKELVFAGQGEDGFTILGYDEDSAGTFACPQGFANWGDYFASRTKAKVIRTNEEALLGKLKVPGAHNRINVGNAAAILRCMGVPAEKIAPIMAGWPGIPHRLEAWLSRESLSFYNDSCSTVPEAALAASRAFGSPVTVICGGTDKDLDFFPMAQIEAEELFLLDGTGTQKLVPLLNSMGKGFFGPYDSLESLLREVKAHADAGKIHSGKIVFSPGCTSFGMFKNEFDRGNKFKSLVEEIF